MSMSLPVFSEAMFPPRPPMDAPKAHPPFPASTMSLMIRYWSPHRIIWWLTQIFTDKHHFVGIVASSDGTSLPASCEKGAWSSFAALWEMASVKFETTQTITDNGLYSPTFFKSNIPSPSLFPEPIAPPLPPRPRTWPPPAEPVSVEVVCERSNKSLLES